MIRSKDAKPEEILAEFTESVSQLLAQLDVKYNELKKLKETQRTYAHHTYKLIANWFNKRGGTNI